MVLRDSRGSGRQKAPRASKHSVRRIISQTDLNEVTNYSGKLKEELYQLDGNGRPLTEMPYLRKGETITPENKRVILRSKVGYFPFSEKLEKVVDLSRRKPTRIRIRTYAEASQEAVA